MRIFVEDGIERCFDTRLGRRFNVGHLLSVVVVVGIAYEIGKPW